MDECLPVRPNQVTPTTSSTAGPEALDRLAGQGCGRPEGHERTSLAFHYCFVGKGANNTRHQPARDDIVSGVREMFSQNMPGPGAVQRRAQTRDEFCIRSKLSPFWKTLVRGFRRIAIRHVEKAGAPS